MNPIRAMPLSQQVLLLHQATLALDRRKTSPPMPRLHTQQHTHMLITVYICDLPPTLQVCIPAKGGSEGALRATLATFAGDCETAGQRFTLLHTRRVTIVF